MNTQVRHQRELECVRRACEEWEKLDPVEVRRWRFMMAGLAEAHEWSGGWSESKELLAEAQAPAFVIYRVGTLLRRLGWEPEASRQWDRIFRAGKWEPSPLWEKAKKYLLPELQTARQERRLRNHSGVDLPST